MLSNSIERAIKEEGEVFRDQAQFAIFLVDRCPRKNLQGGRQQSIVRARMDREARGERKTKLGRHRGEHRALHMTVAVKERMDLAELAEGVAEAKELAVVVRGGVTEPLLRMIQQQVHTGKHFIGQAELKLPPDLELAF